MPCGAGADGEPLQRHWVRRCQHGGRAWGSGRVLPALRWMKLGDGSAWPSIGSMKHGRRRLRGTGRRNRHRRQTGIEIRRARRGGCRRRRAANSLDRLAPKNQKQTVNFCVTRPGNRSSTACTAVQRVRHPRDGSDVGRQRPHGHSSLRSREGDAASETEASARPSRSLRCRVVMILAYFHIIEHAECVFGMNRRTKQ